MSPAGLNGLTGENKAGNKQSVELGGIFSLLDARNQVRSEKTVQHKTRQIEFMFLPSCLHHRLQFRKLSDLGEKWHSDYSPHLIERERVAYAKGYLMKFCLRERFGYFPVRGHFYE